MHSHCLYFVYNVNTAGTSNKSATELYLTATLYTRIDTTYLGKCESSNSVLLQLGSSMVRLMYPLLTLSERQYYGTMGAGVGKVYLELSIKK